MVGQAARAIQGFGKPQNIISKHMDEMPKIPGCVNDNAPQLRPVYDKISVNMRGLESLGVSSNQYSSLLTRYYVKSTSRN